MFESLNQSGIRIISPTDKWCVHGYYTLSPYAPDGSGRLIFAAGDLEKRRSRVCVADRYGRLIDTFGDNVIESNFYHTGCWQTWAPDSQSVFYQSGTMEHPLIVRHDLNTGTDTVLAGDMEGAPPFGEPITSGYLGMLYAAGYANGTYMPQTAPFPFAARDQHGLFKHQVSAGCSTLMLSVEQLLQMHPKRDLLLQEEKLLKDRLGQEETLTLMAYCVRWNTQGSRCLFYFGNHCVDKRRGEPRLSYVFTADKDFKELHLVMDLSFGRRGVHWGWHPDGEHLVGYGPDPEDPTKMCLCTVRYDGTEHRKISKHCSGGHPSICPTDYNLAVTDEGTSPGRVVFIDLTTDTETGSYTLPRTYGDPIPPGRNPFRVCHHPVFTADGSKVLVNTLPGRNAVLCELDTIGRS